MTAQDQLTLKTVIFHDPACDARSLPASRLLNDLGHDVTTTASPEQAMQLLEHDRADLVVIDADRAKQGDFVSRLIRLPADHQPKQVAIFSDAMDAAMTAMVDQLQRAKVHVLLKPLHMHGLLGLLRNIEAKA